MADSTQPLKTARWPLMASGVILCALLLSGCSTLNRGYGLTLQAATPSVVLKEAPFFKQARRQCGAASLAVVLGYNNIHVSMQQLVEQVYLPGRGGALPLEMQATLRKHGLIAQQVEFSAAKLISELNEGHPVLLLLNLGLRIRPVWHYSVVVGWDEEQQSFLLHDGQQAFTAVKAKKLMRQWHYADGWGIVAKRPASVTEPPENTDAAAYLQSLLALEAVVPAAELQPALRGFINKWPDSWLAWLSLGVSYYQLGDLNKAADAFSRSLQLRPDSLDASNNLMQTQIDLGCHKAALATVRWALRTRPFLAKAKPSATMLDTIAQLDPTRVDVQQPDHCEQFKNLK